MPIITCNINRTVPLETHNQNAADKILKRLTKFMIYMSKLYYAC